MARAKKTTEATPATITAKINMIYDDTVLLDVGEGPSLSVPRNRDNFKRPIEKHQKLDISYGIMGPKVKEDADGNVVWQSKNRYATDFKVERYHEPELKIRDERTISKKRKTAPKKNADVPY